MQGSQDLGTRSGFPFLGTRNPMWVPVPRNPGTHNDLPQIEGNNMSKHSSVFKNAQK